MTRQSLFGIENGAVLTLNVINHLTSIIVTVRVALRQARKHCATHTLTFKCIGCTRQVQFQGILAKVTLLNQ